MDYIRRFGQLGSGWKNTRCIILFVISKLYEGDTMKKYLFGLGAMLIGAGLMFVFTHTEVSAKSELPTPDCQMYRGGYAYCKIKDLTCVQSGLVSSGSISCVKSD